MISFLNIDNFSDKLTPITIGIIFNRPDEFHIDGIFSEKIFGPLTSRDRVKTFSYIDLNAFVVNPAALNIILRLDKKIEKFISTEESFKLEKDGTLVIDENGVTGIVEFKKLFSKIKFRGDTPDREKFIELLKKEDKAGKLFVDKLPVIPPSYRDAYKDQESGEWVVDALNDIYITTFRRAGQMKSAPKGPLFDLLNYSLQKSIIDHYDYIKIKVEKKHGLIRNQMLGKRTDFSGRAVITPNPELNVGEVGIPIRMAVELFQPFIMHVLSKSPSVDRDLLKKEVEEYTGIDLSIDSIMKVLKAIKNGDKIPIILENLFFDVIELAMKDRIVLCKRDPVLQTQSYMAYIPILHRGSTIEICTLHVAPHNSDFDGDCSLCDIKIYVNDELLNIHISELENKKELFKIKSVKNKSNGSIVTYYDPLKKFKIDSININNGKTEKKIISGYSKHENIELYKVTDSKDRFKEFHTSFDHSLIVYDEIDDIIKKISPKELLKNPNGKYLIQKNG